MSNTGQATDQLNSIRLLQIIKKWRKQLLYVFIGSAIFSYIISLPVFMKPMYKAYAVIYPDNIQPYSKETPTEQLIQLLNSEDVKDSLITKFNLYRHYAIDTSGAYPRFEMMKQLDENISIRRTEYESIDVQVVDYNPDTAAKICDALIHFTDLKAVSIIRSRAEEQLVIAKSMLDDKQNQLDTLGAAITKLRVDYGITDFENQVTGFSREYYKVLGSGGANTKMEQTRINLQEKGSEYVSLREKFNKNLNAYNEYKIKYDVIVQDLSKKLQVHNTVTKPTVPEKKDSPKRAVVIITFILSTLFLALLVILYQEQMKEKLHDALKDIN